MSTQSHIRKAVVVGASKVGKSVALEKAEGRDYGEDYRQTIGVDFHSIYMKHGSGHKKMHAWDIGGNPQFREIGQPYMKTASLIVLMYDISRAVTLDELMRWHQDWCNLRRGRPVLVVANCIDKHDHCYGAGRAFARSISAPHVAISAKSGQGLEDMVAAMFELCDQVPDCVDDGANESLLGGKKSAGARFCCSRPVAQFR